jgi:hypothetical protein
MLGIRMGLDVTVGQGITIGTRVTVKAPNGETVKSFAVKMVPEGIAFGMTIGDANGERQYIATVDTPNVMAFITHASDVVYTSLRALNRSRNR